MESQPEKPAEEVREIEGKKYRKVPSGYTIREFFSHDGPGWDYRAKLLNKDYAMKTFGREFAEDEVWDPKKLPDTPYYEWKLVEEE